MVHNSGGGAVMRRSMLTANSSLGDVVTKAIAYSNGNTINYPASTAAGDLVLLFSGSYNTAPMVPAGFTGIRSITGTGNWTEYGQASYRIATAGQGGALVSLSGVDPNYCGSVMIVITGHNPTTPINSSNANGTAGAGTTISTNSVTTTAPSRRYLFWSAMASNGSMPVMTIATTGAEIQSDVGGSTGTYHRVQGWRHATMEGAGTHSAHVMNTNTVCGMVGMVVAVASG